MKALTTFFTIMLATTSFAGSNNSDSLLQITSKNGLSIKLNQNSRHIFYLRQENKRGFKRQRISNYEIIDSATVRIFYTEKAKDSLSGSKIINTISRDVPLKYIGKIRSLQQRAANPILGTLLIGGAAGLLYGSTASLGSKNSNESSGGIAPTSIGGQLFVMALAPIAAAGGVILIATSSKSYSFYNHEDQLEITFNTNN